MEYKRLTGQEWSDDIDLKQELGYSYIYKRLHELEDKIEQGKMIECEPNLIGYSIIGIHAFTDGTYQLDTDENIVIGFNKYEVVTWNDTHKFNDYFKKGLYFLDDTKGRYEAEKKLKELQNG